MNIKLEVILETVALYARKFKCPFTSIDVRGISLDANEADLTLLDLKKLVLLRVCLLKGIEIEIDKLQKIVNIKELTEFENGLL